MKPAPTGLQLSTPTDTTIIFSRTFDAPRRRVWDAMFVPDNMRRWMLPPPGFTMTTCECDARIGGPLRIAWKSEDADPAMTLQGVFTDVVLHERIIHTETMALASGQALSSLLEQHEFAENGGVTTMRITQTYDSKDDRDGALASGMDQGMEACYARLDAIIAQPT